MSLQDKLESYIDGGSVGKKKPEDDQSNDPFDSYVKTGKLPARPKREEVIEPVKENPRDKFTDNPLTKGTSKAPAKINNNVDLGDFGAPKTSNSSIDIMPDDQPTPVRDALVKVGKVAATVGAKAIEGGLNAYNKLIEWKDNQRMKSFSYPITNPETGKKETQYKYKNVDEMNADIPLIKMANSPTGQKAIKTVGEKTSNIPLKVAASFKAIGNDTYDEAYSAYLKERSNPENGAFTKFLYDLQDSGPQSALGVLLSLGVTYATKSPSAGLGVSSAYYAALSAGEQLEKKGKVDNLGNIAIDVVGDQILGKSLEALFKDPIKNSILKTAGKSFVTEGSTEVAQSLLKYSNDYGHAKTEKEKQAIMNEAKQYVVNGGLVNEFLVGGVSGALIGGGADFVASKVGGEAGPSMQSKKGAPAPEQTEDEIKADVAKQVENRNFADIRDELATIQDKFQSGEQPTDEEIAKASILSDELTDFQTVASDKAEVIMSPEGDKIAEINTVKYDDGKIGVSLNVSVNDQNLTVPFSATENFGSEKEAVAHAKDIMVNWAKENNLPEDVQANLSQGQVNQVKPAEIKTEEIKSNEVVKENVKKDDLTTPEGVAKDLIRSYVERGDSLAELKAGQLGFAGDGTAVGISGFMDGKRIGPDKILVEKIKGKVVNKVFSLKQIYDEIKAEKKTKPAPVMPSNKQKLDNASASIDNTKKYGNQNDNNSRGNNRQQELPQSVSEGDKKQSQSGTGSVERGESVARGERSKRTPSARERLGSQLILDNDQRAKLAAQATDIVDGEVVTKKDSDMVWPLNEEEKLELQNYETAGGNEKNGADGQRLLDEYYTNPEIVSMTWKMLEGLVPKTARILEPSAGVGRFLSGAPISSKVTAQEISETPARITKIVYPSATVMNTPFESNFVTDRGVSKDFTPTYDLVIGNPPYGAHRGKYKGMGEEQNISKYEEYFIKRSLDLTKEGGYVAFVVPSGFLRSKSTPAKEAISKMAVLYNAYRLPNSSFDKTNIGTDIVVFKKQKNANPSRTDVLAIIDDNHFKKSPDKILGTEKTKNGQFGPEQYVDGTLGEAMDKFDQSFKAKEEVTGAKEEVDEISKPAVERTLGQKTADQEVSPPKTVEPVTQTAKAAVSQKAIIESPKKETDIIKLSDVTNKNNLDVWKNTNATGEISEAYEKQLLNGKPLNEFYSDSVNVVGSDLVNDFNYYQGDIYEKLDQLEADKSKMSPEQYQKQKTGLLIAAPQKHTVDRMNVSPNTNFVHDTKITNPDTGQEIPLATAFERWMDDLPYESFNGSNRYEVVGYVRGESVRGTDKVRNNMIRVRRREVGDKLFGLFLKEGLSISEQAQVEDAYNKSFNSYSRPDYSKVPLVGELHKNFRGKPLEVKPVQLEGVGFLTNKGIGLLAHDVGVGKTMQAILSVNEVMKRGWAKKPLIVTPPGNVYNQWKTEIQEIIPGVKIVDLDNLGARFKGDLSKLEIPEGAISTISYEGFKRLGFKQETYDKLTADLKDVMQMPGDMSKRAAALSGEKVSEQIGKGIKGTTDQKFFEDLGFDHITFDEVHNANHIIKGAKMEGNKGTEFRGLTILPSELGVKTWLATQHILKNNNNRNVFLLSATPFTNHPLEYYSILSLMARERLNKLGLKNVNDFMNMFMDLTYDYEYRADGSYKEKNEIKSFKNYQQFQKLLTEFIDFRDGEEAGVKRPNRISKEYTISQTQDQYDSMEKAQEYFSPKYRDQGGTLVAIGEMRKIALSPFLSRFYNGAMPNYKEFVDESPKIKMTMELIKQNKQDNPSGGQIIYSPIGVEYFPHIKEYLTKEVGYKPNEVAIIAGSVPFNKKIDIQEKFNNGEIKVIIGSDSIKEGVNLQKNTTDMFLLSMPWNFTQMRQVIGRAWRQGNAWKNIRINNIFTENSIDIFLSQKLANKEKRYESALAYKGDNLDVGDIDFDELKFDLATNPVIKAQIEFAYKKKNLEKQIGEIKADAAFYGRKIKVITNLEEQLQQYKDAEKRTEPGTSGNNWYVKAVASTEKELENEKALMKERGLDIEQMIKDVAEKRAPIATLEQELKDLEAEYSTKLTKAEAEKKEAIIKENNYQAPVADRKDDNKTFFAKAQEAKPTGEDFSIIKNKPESEVETVQAAKTPQELAKRIEQLNKVGQKNRILRKAGGVNNPKAAGVFVSGTSGLKKAAGVAKQGEIRLKDSYVGADQENYVTVLAHETGHAIDAAINGGKTNVDTYKVFGDNLTTDQRATLKEELTQVTIDLVGEESYNSNKAYYNKPTELLARYFEKMFSKPGDLAEIAPLATELLEQNQIVHPIIADMLDAANGAIDKDQMKYVPLRDLRETYHKFLGKSVGDVAFNQEIVHRSMVERGKYVIEKFVKEKFKGVKDSPELLFRAAESIKITYNNEPVFGTRDFLTAKTDQDAAMLKMSGAEPVIDPLSNKQVVKEVNGNLLPVFSRQRYTADEARAIYNQLSPEGKKLINEFTAARDEAKDYFNREVIKASNKIDSDIEGWVHHYFPQGENVSGGTTSKLRFKQKQAGAAKFRTNAAGFIEDLQLNMTKALTDLESAKNFNDFIQQQFATVTKPLLKGETPDAGWTEVQGDVIKGVGTPNEKKIVIIKDGKKFVPQRIGYQMPTAIYERYKLYAGVVKEASKVERVLNDINRYWRTNILFQAGSAATNFISGGIQFGSKTLTDFYTEGLTGQLTFPQTRRDMSAMIEAILPSGWTESPDWIYGADKSNFYGQFTETQGMNKTLDAYADKTLKFYGLVERYWKKVITISENGRSLKGLNEMTIEGLKAPSEMEKQLLADINGMTDLFAYDYNNVPLWLETHSKSGLGQAIKPFMKYPYKYVKQLLDMSYGVFDRSRPWQERTAKILALATMMAVYAWYRERRNEERETPAGDEKTPARLSPRGRLFVGKDENGLEKFVRTAKYPFFNVTDFGQSIIDGNYKDAQNIVADMLGGLHPMAELALIAGTNYENEYDRYLPVGVKIGNRLSTYVPGGRILNDISTYFDPFQRKQTTFGQTFGKLIPTTNEDLQRKLHGDVRTEQIPLEGKFAQDKKIKGLARTTFDQPLKNYKDDVALSALLGIYTRRIDPEIAKAVEIRNEKNAKANKAKDAVGTAAASYIDKGGLSTRYKADLVKEVLGDNPTRKDKKKLIDSFNRKVKSLKAGEKLDEQLDLGI